MLPPKCSSLSEEAARGTIWQEPMSAVLVGGVPSGSCGQFAAAFAFFFCSVRPPRSAQPAPCRAARLLEVYSAALEIHAMPRAVTLLIHHGASFCPCRTMKLYEDTIGMCGTRGKQLPSSFHPSSPRLQGRRRAPQCCMRNGIVAGPRYNTVKRCEARGSAKRREAE